LADFIELVYQQLLTDLQQNQADFTLLAAHKRLTQANNNLTSAEKQLSGLMNDTKIWESASMALIRMAQYYMDFLSKYAFYAARSLEFMR